MKKQNSIAKLVSNKLVSSKLVSTDGLQHAGYLAVAKTRAKVLKAFAYVIPIRRKLL